MAAQVGALRVAVGADISGLQVGMKRAERQVQRSAGVMRTAVTGINKSFAGLGAVAGFSLGGAGLIAGASAFLKVADAAKTMTAQLRLATAEYGSFAQANKDVRAIAEGSRSSLTATAELYSTIQRNAGELGQTQAQTARITETVSKSFAVFGTSAMQAEQATRQLVQAFQAGRLNGDEFRSMMENSPRLIKMLADSLGVTVGALREMSKEGELTADKLVAAFSDLQLTAELDKEFAQMPVTFDQAMTQLYNSALITFSAFDAGGQFSTSIANFVTQGSGGFAELEQSAFNFGRGVSDLFIALDEVRNGIASLGSDGVLAFGSLTDATFSWHDALSTVLGILDGVINKFANLAQLPGNLVRMARGQELLLNPSGMQGRFETATNKRNTDASRRNIMGRRMSDVLGEFGKGRNPPPYRAPAGKGSKAKRGGGAKKPPRDRSEEIEYQFENELRQAQMDILRAQESLAKDYQQRADLSLKMLDLERIGFNAELDEKVRRAARDLAEGKITQIAFAKVEAHAQSLRATNEEVDSLKRQAIAQEVLEQQFQDRTMLAEAELTNQQDLLQSQDALATTAAEQRDIQLRLLELSQRQERARLRAILAEESGATIAEKDAAQLRLNALDEIFANQRQGVINSTRNPLEEWAASVPQSAAEINEALQSIQVNGLEGLTSALMGIIDGTQSVQEAFTDLARSVIADIVQMTIKMLIFRAVSAIMGGGLGGGPLPGGMSDGGNWMYGDLATFADGGSFNIKGFRGTDRNVLSLNNMPIARVSHGERINIANDNMGGGGGGGVVEIVLRDQMLDARIMQGAGQVVIRAAPSIIRTAAGAATRKMTRPKLMGGR